MGYLAQGIVFTTESRRTQRKAKDLGFGSRRWGVRFSAGDAGRRRADAGTRGHSAVIANWLVREAISAS